MNINPKEFRFGIPCKQHLTLDFRSAKKHVDYSMNQMLVSIELIIRKAYLPCDSNGTIHNVTYEFLEKIYHLFWFSLFLKMQGTTLVIQKILGHRGLFISI
ncbi:hypothetical protein SLEP1_g30524 [Rubroshorea leprosula]|uniref:Uncharacterized protein n=1 Tax=Rubroshorea leprosula TaxID=152421 RepID=A0AAV5K5Z4_9ROSI|nr:hypothetical protein SLEP1_g30524 [Rubroshorea leprosula]